MKNDGQDTFGGGFHSRLYFGSWNSGQDTMNYEVKKAGWARRVETSRKVTDPKCTFYCDDDLIDFLENNGDHYMLTIVPVERQEAEPEKKPSQLAAIICNDVAFYDFLRKYHMPVIKVMLSNGVKFSDESAEKNAQVVRFGCSVESRSELDTSGDAMDIFYEAFYNPFQLFKKGYDK